MSRHRTQISLDEWHYRILRAVSKEKRKSLSQIIRDLITEKYSGENIKIESDPLFDIVGMASGDGEPAARSHDTILYGEKR